ncbi:Osmotin thaumatin-like protein [Trametes versicolor FP-101664 SS1]|uniref:Osmotin thaumatin-like protein n=1 Tax=Trametes versicolor (strain FP-101664) TaxID=717944 RepID=UPI0004622BF4|nr:Osmotin thaumatin-like protein [Trametes versicolor FP-101664 SS1]EIW53453.1 Osmotin thaumatin-like protein [Trametes versicolor FP-101664 SS1]
MKGVSVIAILASVARVAARTFTVTNNCPFTIWPAIFTNLSVGTAVPDQPTGWEQGAHQSVSFNVPNNWAAGRIWGRRDCNFSVNPGPGSCLDGGCSGGLLCDPHNGTGETPVTVAEFTLSPNTNGVDFYDVSLVEGYNLPVRIDNNKGCRVSDCPIDLGPNCPAELKGPLNSTGSPVGCNSACSAGLGDPTNNPNCCTGTHSTAATCPPSGVAFYSYFKGNCPNSMIYEYDESSGTPLWTCGGNLQPDYTVTFCP